MIEIRPHGLYTRSDLDKIFCSVVFLAYGWVARLKPVKRFRLAWWGEDLLAAIRKAMKFEPSIDWLLENQDKIQHSYFKRGLAGEL